MKFDVVGRMRNMRLPDGKAAILYSVYEAVSNAVHAIEDKFGKSEVGAKGDIQIDVLTDPKGNVESVSIADNGTGLDDDQLEAFETCDSRYKEPRGGKGVGRLIWVKVFGSITVHTRFLRSDSEVSFSFDFHPELEGSITNKRGLEDRTIGFGTRVVLQNAKQAHQEKVRKISFLRDLALHFFSYYLAGSMPKLTVALDDASETFDDFIKGKLRTPTHANVEFEADDVRHSLTMTHLYAEPTISKELKNSILLTAHHRLVGEPIEISRKFALDQLPDKLAYIGVVSGTFLDERVDQE